MRSTAAPRNWSPARFVASLGSWYGSGLRALPVASKTPFGFIRSPSRRRSPLTVGTQSATRSSPTSSSSSSTPPWTSSRSHHAVGHVSADATVDSSWDGSRSTSSTCCAASASRSSRSRITEGGLDTGRGGLDRQAAWPEPDLTGSAVGDMSRMTYHACRSCGPAALCERGDCMRADVARRLRARGWKIGDATEFLGLSEQEAALVELRLALSRSVRERRLKLGVVAGGPRVAPRLEPIARRQARGCRCHGLDRPLGPWAARARRKPTRNRSRAGGVNPVA